jgi:hypothetical protein
MKHLRRLARRNPTAFEREVNFMRNRLPKLKAAVLKRVYMAHDKSAKNLDAVVKDLKELESDLKIVRDGATDVLLIGAACLSGGAAFAVLGAGSVMSGVNKYQDTGNAQAAVIKGVGTFVVGAVSRGTGGKALTGREKAVVMFIGASFDGAEALAEGKSTNQALVAAGTSVLGTAVGDKVGGPRTARQDTCGTSAPGADGSHSSNTARHSNWGEIQTVRRKGKGCVGGAKKIPGRQAH